MYLAPTTGRYDYCAQFPHKICARNTWKHDKCTSARAGGRAGGAPEVPATTCFFCTTPHLFVILLLKTVSKSRECKWPWHVPMTRGSSCPMATSDWGGGVRNFSCQDSLKNIFFIFILFPTSQVPTKFFIIQYYSSFFLKGKERAKRGGKKRVMWKHRGSSQSSWHTHFDTYELMNYIPALISFRLGFFCLIMWFE